MKIGGDLFWSGPCAERKALSGRQSANKVPMTGTISLMIDASSEVFRHLVITILSQEGRAAVQPVAAA